jgi:nucleotide-binding universal stress UspA family protein
MPYQHILVAVDLTEECDPVMHRAQKLAASSGAKLSVVHIVEPMAMAFGGDVPMDLSMLQQQQRTPGQVFRQVPQPQQRAMSPGLRSAAPGNSSPR